MFIQAFLPNPHLRPFISRYYYIRVTSGQFHFPADGCPGFIINLGHPFSLGFDKQGANLFKGCRLFGSSTRFMMTQHVAGPTELLAVKYRPGQLSRFFNVSAIGLTDTSVSLQTLCGGPGREVEEKLYEAKQIQHLVELLDDTLMRCLSNALDHYSRGF